VLVYHSYLLYLDSVYTTRSWIKYCNTTRHFKREKIEYVIRNVSKILSACGSKHKLYQWIIQYGLKMWKYMLLKMIPSMLHICTCLFHVFFNISIVDKQFSTFLHRLNVNKCLIRIVRARSFEPHKDQLWIFYIT